MKKLLLIAIVALISSCEVNPNHRLNYEISHTVVARIDGCEYILYSTKRTDGGVCIIHKANCDNHK